DADARFTPGAWYVAGLLALGLLLHQAGLSPRGLGLAAAWTLAAYVLVAAAAGWLSPRLTRWRWALHLPGGTEGWPEAFYLTAQGMTAAVAVALGMWGVLDFEFFAERATGAAALLLLVPAGVLMTQAVSARWGRDWR